MAFEAIAVRHAELIENFANSMRRMAIYAYGNVFRFFLPELAADNFAMDSLDLAVTLLTHFGDVILID